MDFSGALVQIYLIDVSRCARCIVLTMKVALSVGAALLAFSAQAATDVRHRVRCGYRRFSVLLGQQPSLHVLLRSTASSVLRRCSPPRCRACGSYCSSLSPTVPLLTGGGRPQGLGSHVPRGPRVSVHAWGIRLRSVPVTYLRDVVRRSVAFQLA
jgi:hypothetical protein